MSSPVPEQLVDGNPRKRQKIAAPGPAVYEIPMGVKVVPTLALLVALFSTMADNDANLAWDLLSVAIATGIWVPESRARRPLFQASCPEASIVRDERSGQVVHATVLGEKLTARTINIWTIALGHGAELILKGEDGYLVLGRVSADAECTYSIQARQRRPIGDMQNLLTSLTQLAFALNKDGHLKIDKEIIKTFIAIRAGCKGEVNDDDRSQRIKEVTDMLDSLARDLSSARIGDFVVLANKVKRSPYADGLYAMLPYIVGTLTEDEKVQALAQVVDKKLRWRIASMIKLGVPATMKTLTTRYDARSSQFSAIQEKKLSQIAPGDRFLLTLSEAGPAAYAKWAFYSKDPEFAVTNHNELVLSLKSKSKVRLQVIHTDTLRTTDAVMYTSTLAEGPLKGAADRPNAPGSPLPNEDEDVQTPIIDI